MSNMIEWHSRMHGIILDDEDATCQNCALNWARDAGKLQAIMDILFEVNMGDLTISSHLTTDVTGCTKILLTLQGAYRRLYSLAF